jgi:hypothetical protein
MGLYNFKPQFEPFILDWTKRHTIRGERQHADCPGKPMHLFVGLRHPGARCLMRPMCVRTEFVRIEGGPNTPHKIRMGFSLGLGADEEARIGTPIYGSATGGPLVTLVPDEANALAWADGFRPLASTVDDPMDAFGLMMRFWDGRLPFEGSINHWNPARQVVRESRGWRWADVIPAATHHMGRL